MMSALNDRIVEEMAKAQYEIDMRSWDNWLPWAETGERTFYLENARVVFAAALAYLDDEGYMIVRVKERDET